MVISAILVLVLMVVLGQDNNWDLHNYHLYTPTALIEGRFAGDIAVAQLQTWHNPTLDFPMALMVSAGWPGWCVALWLTLPALVAVAMALRVLDLVWPDARSLLRTACAGVIAVSGAAVMPAIGTTTNDAFVGAGMLTALWWAVASHDRRGPWATWLPVGLMAGLAAGLKIAGAFYCVGFIAVALVAGSWRTSPLRLIALALGGLIGTLITAGPWAWLMWQEHHNPMFPYLNYWFLSPDALPVNIQDRRFVTNGIEMLWIPFRLLTENQLYSELKLADSRLLLGLSALVVACFSAVKQRDARPRMLLAFVLASFAAWAPLYGIYRYLFGLELVCSIAIVGTLSHWLPARTARIMGLVLAAMALAAFTIRPNWGRIAFSTPMVTVTFPELPANAMVLMGADSPLGYAVTALPQNTPAISIRNNFMDPERCTHLQMDVESRIRVHAGPILLLREPAAPQAQQEGPWTLYGLAQLGKCQSVKSNLGDLELCPLVRESATVPVCSVQPTGQ